jgi:hypothetical protein
MSTEIPPEVYSRALKAAEALKCELEERLIGKTMSGMRSPIEVGPARVVAITIPTSSYPHLIANWLAWECAMKEDNGKEWSQGLSDYIHWAELFHLFRNAFSGIEVEVEHPYAQLYHGGNFTGSGRIVVVNENTPAFVRPIGDLSRSVWLNAELRIDTNLQEYGSKEPMVVCNIDPLEFGQKENSRGIGFYNDLPDPSNLPTFCIRIPGGGFGDDMYVPIARVVARTGSEITFELDQSVESVHPDRCQLLSEWLATFDSSKK